jgi:hypothetical protein
MSTMRTVATCGGVGAAMAAAGWPAAAIAASVGIAAIAALCWVVSSPTRTRHVEKILLAVKRSDRRHHR